jgi:hypothetical protein
LHEFLQHEDLLDWNGEARVAASVPETLLVDGGRTMRRMIATTVQSINQRIITVTSQNLSFDLNKVECNFIMKAGMCIIGKHATY